LAGRRTSSPGCKANVELLVSSSMVSAKVRGRLNSVLPVGPLALLGAITT
jgi:hypothetical protein